MNIKLRVAAALAAVVSAVTASGFAFASAGSGSTGPEAPAEGFVVRAEGVAVFPPDGGEAVKMTDIELKSLPSVDRIALEDGIFVENSEELAKILEDLGS